MSKSPLNPNASWKKILYGPGGVSENFGVNFFYQMVNPVFVVALGVDVALAGIAMAVPRFIDAFTDPIMGSVSDNWRGRWGKRRPFIFLGAILSAMCIAGLAWTPEDASTEFHSAWLVTFLLLATIGSTMFVIPYTAMGFELPESKHERTIWMAWRSTFQKFSGIGVQWLYWLIQLSVFGGTLFGARKVGLVVALIVIVAGTIPAIFLKENLERVDSVKRSPFLKSWLATVKNRNFRILALSSLLVYASILLVDGLGFFLQLYYVFEGNEQSASWFKGAGGTIFHLSGLAATPLIAMAAKRFGKIRALELCILSIAVGGFSKLICWYPGAGWLVVVPSFFMGPGLVAVFVLLFSLLADVAAEDERLTGVSRQGMYSASFQFISKLSLSGVFALSGIIIKIIGFDRDLGAAQDPGVFDTMRWVFSSTTIILVLVAYFILKLFRPPKLS